MENEFKNQCSKFIAISRLKLIAPEVKSKKKIDFINHLIKKDKPLLESLLEYAQANSKKELFLLRVVKNKEKFNENALVQFFKNKNRYMLEDGKILDFKASVGSELTVQIKAHSEVKKKKAEDAETLALKTWEYRSPFKVNLILHCKDLLIEAKTGSEDKVSLFIEFMDKEFFNNSGCIIKTVFQIADLKKIDKETKSKNGELIVNNVAGLNGISFTGNNLESALDILKRKGMNLYSLGDVILSSYEPRDYPINFYPNGRISYRKFKGDIYKDILLKLI